MFNPATEAVIAHVADCKKADVDLAVAAARKAFDSGPWPDMSPSAARQDPLEDRRSHPGESRGAGAARVARQRQADRRRARRRRAPRGGPLPLHGGLGDQDRRQHHRALGPLHAGRRVSRLYAQGADRRRGADHSVEFPAADGGLEARARRSPPVARSCSSPPKRRRCRRCGSRELCQEAGLARMAC